MWWWIATAACAYCVNACPYDARFINAKTQTADKCTFCAHRLEAELLPACVESCVGGARIIGDMRDPGSEISRLMDQHRDELMVLQPEKGTLPQVFYLGMDEHFTHRPAAEPGIWDVINEAGKELGYSLAPEYTVDLDTGELTLNPDQRTAFTVCCRASRTYPCARR